MVTINQKKCTACGICVKICHEHCMSIENKTVKINHAFCSTCSQCIAVCPFQALSWDKSKPVPFNKKLYPSPAQMDELLKERRTTRDFVKRPVGRALLEEIADYGVYAPTHNFNLRTIIIDNESIIGLIDRIIFNYTKGIYNFFFKPKIFEKLANLFAPAYKNEYLKVKPKLEASLERGRQFKTPPAAILFIIADKRVYLSLESAQYALYNMDLYAQARGLACRNLVGNQMILNGSKELRKKLNLKKHERIFGTLCIGWPAVKFKNKVNGRRMPVQWNEGAGGSHRITRKDTGIKGGGLRQ